MTETVLLKETLNKSHHKIVCTSCLHISRQPAQKILVMRQHYCGLFVQPDEKSDGAICTNDLISVSLITLLVALAEVKKYIKKK